MRQRFRLYRRKNGGRYYLHDSVTGKQESLGTSDRATAIRLFHSKNEAGQNTAINLQIARAYSPRPWSFLEWSVTAPGRGHGQSVAALLLHFVPGSGLIVSLVIWSMPPEPPAAGPQFRIINARIFAADRKPPELSGARGKSHIKSSQFRIVAILVMGLSHPTPAMNAADSQPLIGG